MKALYMDNAATSFPKPRGVIEAMVKYQKEIGASAGRGSYPNALKTGEVLYETRVILKKLFNLKLKPERIIFTFNATDGLNLVIKGAGLKKGDSVLISNYEHNSVIRPLNELNSRLGIEVIVAEVSEFEKKIKKNTKMVVLNHASNVTGFIQDFEKVSQFAKRKGLIFIVDAAQSAGCIEIDLSNSYFSAFCFPGHKSLLGPLGTGAVIINDGFDFLTLKEGGTGSVSEKDTQPDFYPDKYESGSHNAIGIFGLHSALKWILNKGVKNIRKNEKELVDTFIKEISKNPNIIIYDKNVERAPVISVNVVGISPQKLADILYKKFKIMVRAGLHCSPLAHKKIGTYPSGTCRFSFGPFIRIDEVLYAAKSLNSVAS
ncbi:MAG: aminotransferase class V-fold PLP-dependent enzyme [bacterium]|nr:aminotransferase class V-fold PLP-dependent enzyme [bacterium]